MSIIANLISKVGGVVDVLSTSDHERLKAKAELEKIQTEAEKSLNEHMNVVVNAQKETLLAELKSEDRFVRWWRPMLMWVIIFMLTYNYIILELLRLFQVVFDMSFFLPQEIHFPKEVFTILQLSVGGYVVGRSGEKIANKILKK